MRAKVISLLFCLVVVANIMVPIALIVGEPSSSLGGISGLANSPWPMFRHNLNHTGLSPYDTSANPGKLKWSFTTDHYVESSPAIDLDGTIYVGSDDNKLYAINPDGTEKWNFTTGDWVYSSSAIGSDGTIYVGSIDNKLYAIGTPGIPPIADADPDQTINEGAIVHFNASSSYDPDGTIESYEWDFDESDGLWWETSAMPDATGPTPTHIYGDNGLFVVTLRVTDDDNLTAVDTCNITQV